MLCMILTRYFQGGYGATVARLTPDQKVGSSNLSALIFNGLTEQFEDGGWAKICVSGRPVRTNQHISSSMHCPLIM